MGSVKSSGIQQLELVVLFELYLSLRIQMCLEISPIFLFWGWDFSTIIPTRSGGVWILRVYHTIHDHEIQCLIGISSLNLTFSSLKINLWKMNFLLGWPSCRCYVSFREGILLDLVEMI